MSFLFYDYVAEVGWARPKRFTYVNSWIRPSYWGSVLLCSGGNLALTQLDLYLAGALVQIALLPICLVWAALFRLDVYRWYVRTVQKTEQEEADGED